MGGDMRNLRWLSRRRVLIACVVLVTLTGVGLACWSYWCTGELLRRGEEALAVREYAKARDYLERYLSARPGD